MDRWNIKRVWQQNIYYGGTKVRNYREHAEIKTIHGEVMKTPIFEDISKDPLQEKIDKFVENWSLLNPFNPNALFLYPLKRSEKRKERVYWERMGYTVSFYKNYINRTSASDS